MIVRESFQTETRERIRPTTSCAFLTVPPVLPPAYPSRRIRPHLRCTPPPTSPPSAVRHSSLTYPPTMSLHLHGFICSHLRLAPRPVVRAHPYSERSSKEKEEERKEQKSKLDFPRLKNLVSKKLPRFQRLVESLHRGTSNMKH